MVDYRVGGVGDVEMAARVIGAERDGGRSERARGGFRAVDRLDVFPRGRELENPRQAAKLRDKDVVTGGVIDRDAIGVVALAPVEPVWSRGDLAPIFAGGAEYIDDVVGDFD